jgi:hypothetical protein
MTHRRIAALVLALAVGLSGAAIAQSVTVKGGQSVDVGPVYWIENCTSMLEGFSGIVLTSGPPGVVLSLRKENVIAARQQCKQPVPGATVVATTPVVTQPVSGTLKYQVTYLTRNGKRTSDHSREITITP